MMPMQTEKNSGAGPRKNMKPNKNTIYNEVKMLKIPNKIVPTRFRVLVVCRSILSLYPPECKM